MANDREEGNPPSSLDSKHRSAPPADKAIRGPRATKGTPPPAEKPADPK